MSYTVLIVTISIGLMWTIWRPSEPWKAIDGEEARNKHHWKEVGVGEASGEKSSDLQSVQMRLVSYKSKFESRELAFVYDGNFLVNFDGFETILVSYRNVSRMTSKGRTRSHSIMMVTGNGKGLVGFTLFNRDTKLGPMPIQSAVNRAGLRLFQINLFEDRTGESYLILKLMLKSNVGFYLKFQYFTIFLLNSALPDCL